MFGVTENYVKVLFAYTSNSSFEPLHIMSRFITWCRRFKVYGKRWLVLPLALVILLHISQDLRLPRETIYSIFEVVSLLIIHKSGKIKEKITYLGIES